MEQRQTLRELAVAAASAAGDLVARAHAHPGTLTAETKSPGDYVTDVDRSAEQAAIRVLREGAPDIATRHRNPAARQPGSGQFL